MNVVNNMLPADLQMGHVALTIPDLERGLDFYTNLIGLEIRRQTPDETYLGTRNTDLVVLVQKKDAPLPVRRAPGLYHFALLVPTRRDLAMSLLRLARGRWPLQGASDHGVSEALYLADPFGNGIEIYRDRERADWPFRGGHLQMITEPLDLQAVLGELGADWQQAPVEQGVADGTRMGHVHLKVGNIAESRHFYCQVLGFDLIQQYGPSALFVSAGGYHHHIGLNTWESSGAPPVPGGTAGLRYLTIMLPDRAGLERVVERVQRAGVPTFDVETGVQVIDPAQNVIRLVVS